MLEEFKLWIVVLIEERWRLWFWYVWEEVEVFLELMNVVSRIWWGFEKFGFIWLKVDGEDKLILLLIFIREWCFEVVNGFCIGIIVVFFGVEDVVRVI